MQLYLHVVFGETHSALATRHLWHVLRFGVETGSSTISLAPLLLDRELDNRTGDSILHVISSSFKWVMRLFISYFGTLIWSHLCGSNHRRSILLYMIDDRWDWIRTSQIGRKWTHAYALVQKRGQILLHLCLPMWCDAWYNDTHEKLSTMLGIRPARDGNRPIEILNPASRWLSRLRRCIALHQHVADWQSQQASTRRHTSR